MRAAEKEVDALEKQVVEEAEQEGRTLPPGEIKLPMFKELQAKKRAAAQKKFLEERAQLEKNVSDIDKQILQIQKALQDVDGVQTIDTFFRPSSTDFSEEMTAELANIIARARSQGKDAIIDEFQSQFPGKGSKKTVGSKIDTVGIKEKRADEGDTAPHWYVNSDHTHLLTKETKKHIGVAKEDRLEAKGKKRKAAESESEEEKVTGAKVGGEFVEFPDYDGEEEPVENKKAFTLFCKRTRKEVKNSLPSEFRKNKVSLYFCIYIVCLKIHTSH